MTKFETFKALHLDKKAFILPNVWNAESARLVQEAGFKATATSSAAVANSLGYEDGENIIFEEYLFVIRRITVSVDIPFSVDIETGFGHTPREIAERIKSLSELGVSGINIEDSVIQTSSRRTLSNASEFAEKIRGIKNSLLSENIPMFINVRSDTFLLDVTDKLEETKKRAKLYEKAGADGLFLPGIEDKNEIEQMVSSTGLPLNVMSTPVLPGFDTLNRLGVKRVSLADYLFKKVYSKISAVTKKINEDQSCSPLF